MPTVDSSTRLIRLKDKAYPKYLYDMRQDNMQNSFGSTIESEKLANFPNQYAYVYLVDQPEGDVVTEGQPVLNEEDGNWYQHWDVRAFNDEELAERLASARDIALQDAKSVFSNDLTSGLEVTLQASGDKIKLIMTAEERVNLMGMRVVAETRINKSDDTKFTIRTAVNTSVQVEPAEVVELVEEALELYNGYLEKYWLFKSAVANATVAEELPSVPATFGPDVVETPPEEEAPAS